MEFSMHPIGVIRSPFTDSAHTPIQAARSEAIGHIEVYPEYAEGLLDIDELSHLILLYVFHRSLQYTLMVKPFLDDQLHGLFATRYPARPNPIGLSIVRLVERDNCILTVEGVDMLDGTPLLDIKPYIPEFDIREGVHAGWYEHRSKP